MSAVAAAGWLLGGGGAGALHFTLLRWNVRALVPRSWPSPRGPAPDQSPERRLTPDDPEKGDAAGAAAAERPAPSQLTPDHAEKGGAAGAAAAQRPTASQLTPDHAEQGGVVGAAAAERPAPSQLTPDHAEQGGVVGAAAAQRPTASQLTPAHAEQGGVVGAAAAERPAASQLTPGQEGQGGSAEQTGRRRGGVAARLLPLVRMPLTAALLFAAARHGAMPLLLMGTGLLGSRPFILRWAA
jgi:hypothetical protein